VPETVFVTAFNLCGVNTVVSNLCGQFAGSLRVSSSATH